MAESEARRYALVGRGQAGFLAKARVVEHTRDEFDAAVIEERMKCAMYSLNRALGMRQSETGLKQAYSIRCTLRREQRLMTREKKTVTAAADGSSKAATGNRE